MPRSAGGWVRVCRAVMGRLVVVVPWSVIAGCGGGSGGPGPSVVAASHGPKAASTGSATISLAAAPAFLPYKGTSTLSWQVHGAKTCLASGGWSGTRPAAGTEVVGPLEQDTTFRLSCANSGGGVLRRVKVTVGADEPPTITLAARPVQVAPEGSARLTWSVRGATRCWAGGHWRGAQPVTGSFGTGPLSRTGSYELTCRGPGGTSLASVAVEVLDRVLHWQAPSRNADGSSLKDLAGYRIYWGTKSGVYGPPHTIARPDVTHWEVNEPPGTYYFALTAFGRDGSESGYSNEVQKIIP